MTIQHSTAFVGARDRQRGRAPAIGSAMNMLQEVAGAASSPSVSEWRAILIVMAGGVSAVFGSLTLVQKGRADDLKENIAALRAERAADDAAHERALQAERDRTARAEKAADDAMTRLASTIAITAEQTAAIREFGTIVKEGAVESRRIPEHLDMVARTSEDVRRAVVDHWPAQAARPSEAAPHGD